jgi:hypothetical protein
MPHAIAASPVSFLAYLMAMMYFFHYAGKVLWMLLARLFIPCDYRLCMLQGTRERLSRIDRGLARATWGISCSADNRP